jgi:predicted neuraminidase
MLTTSADDGATWSEPWKLGDHEEIGHLIGPVKNKPVQLADGSILCPSSTEHKGWRVHFEVTRDFGKIWEVIGPINDASNYNAIQPSILTYPDGRMQVLCRTREKVIAQSWSKDGGWSWGPLTATHLPNPNAGTDALTLFDGRQLLVYNHSVREGDRNGRQILNVGLSNDGEKWKPVLTLENEGNAAGYSYPAVIQDSDGQVHITYTWRRLSVKHVILDPDQLR